MSISSLISGECLKLYIIKTIKTNYLPNWMTYFLDFPMFAVILSIVGSVKYLDIHVTF